jgi:hypothetical protein
MFVSTIFLSCGGDGGSPSDPATDEPRVLSISLDQTGGTPATRIPIEGIPGDIEWVYARVTVPDGGTAAVTPAGGTEQQNPSGYAFLDRTDDGYELLVPLHPLQPLQGGSVEIEVTNGSTITSNRVTLDVQGLPEAPGAYDRLITKLEAFLDAWIAQAGTNAEALRTMPADQLSVQEIPLLVVHTIVNHPDNVNSLRAFADGDIPLFSDESIDRGLLDAVAEASGLDGYLDERMALVDTLNVPDPGSRRTAAASPRRTASSSLICVEGPKFDIGPDDCSRLAYIMGIQAEVEHNKGLAANKVGTTVRDLALTALGATRAAGIAWAIGESFWASETATDSWVGLYPSRFVNDATDYGAGPLIFAEDFTQPGTWSDFRVTAVSKGWRFDDVLRDAVDKVKGASKVSQTAADELIAEEAVNGVVGKYKETFEDPIFDRMVQELGIEDLTKLEFCPQSWDNIDCTGKPYSEGRSPSLDVDSEKQTFKPTEVGKTTLTVGTSALFGRVQPTAEAKEVETRQIEVSLDPYQVTAGVDEVISFTLTVTNAENKAVKWTTSGSQAADTSLGPDGGTLTTPPKPWDPSIVLTARSLANTGLRAGMVDSDPREDSSPVEYEEGKILVSPSFACVAPDGKKTFSATVIGIENKEVTWSHTGVGRLEGSTYFAPQTGGGEALVTATSVENPNVSGTAQVVVADCLCAWGARISGDLTATWSGEWAVWTADQGGFSGVQMFPSSGQPVPAITGTLTSPIQPGMTGTLEFLTLQITDGTIEGTYVGPVDGQPAPQLEIVTNDGVTIEGFITGILAAGTVGNPRLVEISAGIKAAEITSNGGSPCSAE